MTLHCQHLCTSGISVAQVVRNRSVLEQRHFLVERGYPNSKGNETFALILYYKCKDCLKRASTHTDSNLLSTMRRNEIATIFKKKSTQKFSKFDFEKSKDSLIVPVPTAAGCSSPRPPALFVRQTHKPITHKQKCLVLGIEIINLHSQLGSLCSILGLFGALYF